MTNQEKVVTAMSDLLDLLIDLTTQIKDSQDSLEIIDIMSMISDITTNTKRLGDTVVFENTEQPQAIESEKSEVVKDKKKKVKDKNAH